MPYTRSLWNIAKRQDAPHVIPRICSDIKHIFCCDFLPKDSYDIWQPIVPDYRQYCHYSHHHKSIDIVRYNHTPYSTPQRFLQATRLLVERQRSARDEEDDGHLEEHERQDRLRTYL